MFCYGPDIAQLQAWWLSVKNARKEKRISTDKEALQIFHKAYHENYNTLTENLPYFKNRLNAALFVSLIKALLPEGSEEDNCDSTCELFQDMEWAFYLKLVKELEFEEELRNCLCQLEEKIYLDIVKLILETCQRDEELKLSRLANPILGSIFIRYPTLKPPKKYHTIISSTALWLLEIKPDSFSDFNNYYSCFMDTASAFADMLLNVIGEQLLARVGTDYQIGVPPVIKNLKPFTSAKHWIHMARLFHNYTCPHHWHHINRFNHKMQSIRFLMRCIMLFNINIFHPKKKPKLMKVFSKQDRSFNNIWRFLDEQENKDIDDHLDGLEEMLQKVPLNVNTNIYFLQTYVAKHVVYSVMQKLLSVCMKAPEESRKNLSLHFLNMSEQSLLPPETIFHLYLEVCQGSELLKQPDFTQEITTFLNQATEAHSVEELVPPIVQLCLQSPKNVIFNVIHRALESKGHIPTLAKLLSEVTLICRYKEKSHPSSLLVTCLKSYTKKATSIKQVENLTYFVQELAKQKPPKDPLDLSEFTSTVIVPLLRPDSIPLQTDLACQLLHTMLDSSSTSLSCNVTVLAVTLVHFANRYLNSAELSKKDKFFSLLKKLGKQLPETLASPELEWLKKQLKDFHPILRIQAAELFHLPHNSYSVQGINNLEKSLLQSTCIPGDSPIVLATKYLNSLPQAMRYAALVAALTKVLPVISQSDWVPVLQLVKVLLNDIFEQSGNQQSNENTVLALRATTDSLVVHQKNNVPTNWSYVLSSYGQAVKYFSSVLAEESEHLSYAFCEVCRLANALPPESNQHLLSTLLQISDQALNSPKNEHGLMLKVAVNSLTSESLKVPLQIKIDKQ